MPIKPSTNNHNHQLSSPSSANKIGFNELNLNELNFNELSFDELNFSNNILNWFAKHGRHHLPWQVSDPYRVWVSEIMLQQTQVATVIGYYNRFMARFDSLPSLAAAPLDEVMAHWAGLGYYSRARNLHQTAKALYTIIKETGDYPQTLDEWQALAGIGRSTAGAILAMGLGKFGVICDGNVKRVLTRHFAIAGDITKSATDKQLWQIAEQLTPKENSGNYAQAMMDLGATLCTRTRPNCPACPIQSTCQAYKQGTPTAYPVKTKKTNKPTHHASALYICHQGKVLFIKRPSNGIWGDLWCLPMHTPTKPESVGEQALYGLLATLDISTNSSSSLSPSPNSIPSSSPISLRHSLTHFHWQINLTIIHINNNTAIDELLTKHKLNFIWADKKTQQALSQPRAMQKLLINQND